MEPMETQSLSSSRSSSLMSEIAELFPDLKTTCDSLESSCEIGLEINGIMEIDPNVGSDVFEPNTCSYSKKKTIIDNMVIKMLESKVRCKTISMSDVGTFNKGKQIKTISELKEIGRGTYGRVLLSRHIKTKTLLAIKQPCRSQNHHLTDETVNEFLDATKALVIKEALVHELLSDSPFFPTFRGTVEIGDDLCLALDFVGNKKLGKSCPLLEPPSLSMADGLDIAEDVVKGMIELHDHGLLHNDLKTDNVLLEKRNKRYHAVIIDFGMVSTISTPLQMKGLPETLKIAYIHGEEGDYVAPEVILEGQSTSVSSDVFSVGKILEDIAQVIAEHSPFLKELSSLANRCMKRNPDNRPSLTSVLNQIGAIKTQEKRSSPIPFWKRLIKNH